jgi:hypothetical protein
MQYSHPENSDICKYLHQRIVLLMRVEKNTCMPGREERQIARQDKV